MAVSSGSAGPGPILAAGSLRSPPGAAESSVLRVSRVHCKTGTPPGRGRVQPRGSAAKGDVFRHWFIRNPRASTRNCAGEQVGAPIPFRHSSPTRFAFRKRSVQRPFPTCPHPLMPLTRVNGKLPTPLLPSIYHYDPLPPRLRREDTLRTVIANKRSTILRQPPLQRCEPLQKFGHVYSNGIETYSKNACRS